MLGVVASVLAVVSKQMQQLPTVLDLQFIVGRIQSIRLCKLKGDHVWYSCMAPAMLEKLRKRFQHCCSTPRRLRNKRNVGSCNFCSNSQQHATTCKRVCNRIQETYSGSSVRALLLLTFMGNVNKRQHLNLLVKMWQNLAEILFISNFSQWRP